MPLLTRKHPAMPDSMDLRLKPIYLPMSSPVTSIRVQLPDGSQKELPAGSTPLDVAKSISPRLASAAVVARIRPLNGNGSTAAAAVLHETEGEAAMYSAENTHGERLVDLSAPLHEDVALEILTERTLTRSKCYD